jgi:hypothetical protein
MNREDVAGDGGVGEGGKGEGGDGGRGRSMTKLVLSTELVGIKNNNQPMVVLTVSRGMRTRLAIEQRVREVRQEREDSWGGRSLTKPMTCRRPSGPKPEIQPDQRGRDMPTLT